LQAICDLFAIAEKQNRTPNCDDVAEAKQSELAILTIDLGAVGAIQIGEDQAIVILLDLQMATADALIIELNGITFFSTNRNGRAKVGKYSTTICALKHSQCDQNHGERFSDWNG
jgi:hypothetical protein